MNMLPPSVIMVDSISQTIIPEARNGMYSAGSCFHRPTPMLLITPVKMARLIVPQNGPIVVPQTVEQIFARRYDEETKMSAHRRVRNFGIVFYAGGRNSH